MAVLFLNIFGWDPSKMDQIHKFGEQTSQILKFKPEGLEGFWGKIKTILDKTGKFRPQCAQQFLCASAIPMYTFLFYVLRYATGCESEERRCLYKVGPTLLLFNDLHFPKPFLECVCMYKKQNKSFLNSQLLFLYTFTFLFHFLIVLEFEDVFWLVPLINQFSVGPNL